MKKSIKAVLFSAFAYPGAGHCYLKKYPAALLFASAFSVPLFFVVRLLITKANEIIVNINNGQIPLDIISINQSLLDFTSSSQGQEVNIGLYFMVFVWFAAMVDCYRLGRKND